MNLLEKEVTRWELPGADIANVYRADRNDSLQLWWTPIEEFKAFALNVFSPVGKVLWNFAEYHAFRSGAVDYVHRLQAKESTLSTLNAVIRDAGADLRSDLASELLGGFTGHFGDRFEPRHPEQPSFLSVGRHISIAVPESCQPMVSRYFQEQARVFGESATRPFPEDAVLAYFNRESDRTLSNLLYKNVFAMSDSERSAAMALIRSGVNMLMPERPELLVFTGNAVALSALGMESDRMWFSDFSDIARFRVEVAIRHGSLPVIEKLKHNLASKEWGLLTLADLRDELRGRLNTKLAAYPVIETNPFELAET